MGSAARTILAAAVLVGLAIYCVCAAGCSRNQSAAQPTGPAPNSNPMVFRACPACEADNKPSITILVDAQGQAKIEGTPYDMQALAVFIRANYHPGETVAIQVAEGADYGKSIAPIVSVCTESGAAKLNISETSQQP